MKDVLGNMARRLFWLSLYFLNAFSSFYNKK